jgi:predicted phosphodiesterase
MTTPQHIGENAAWLREDFPAARVCFFGHSHEQRVYEVQGAEVRQLPAEGRLRLERDRLYFINPGSVDASRKHRPTLAECALFDSGERSIEFLRVPYDAAAAEAKAAVFGYRINPWMDRLYAWRRRLHLSF